MKVQKQNIEKDQGPHLLHQRAQRVADRLIVEKEVKNRGTVERFRPKRQHPTPISMTDMIDEDIIQGIETVQIDIEKEDLVTGLEVSIGT